MAGQENLQRIPDQNETHETPYDVEAIVAKRLEAQKRPPENKEDREIAKSQFLSEIEEVLATYGTTEEVSLRYSSHTGEMKPTLFANKRTAQTTLENGQIISLTEELAAVSPTTYIRDIYLIKADDATIYMGGNAVPGRRNESFVAVDVGRRASIDEIDEGRAIVARVAKDLQNEQQDPSPL
jgi:hypothetical protein